MPLAKPKSDEDKQTFLNRCMGDSLMKDEFSDEDQRYKVCLKQWQKENNAMNHIEKRVFPFKSIRIEGEDDKPKILGFVPYNSETEDLGFREVIKPGAFNKSLKSGDTIYALWSHNDSKPLGNTSSGTLRLRDNPDGLQVEIEPDMSITWASDAYRSAKRGDVQGMSFGFIVNKGGENWTRDGVRELIDVRLLELSPCVFPAYPSSKTQARNKQNSDRDKLTNDLNYFKLKFKFMRI